MAPEECIFESFDDPEGFGCKLIERAEKIGSGKMFSFIDQYTKIGAGFLISADWNIGNEKIPVWISLFDITIPNRGIDAEIHADNLVSREKQSVLIDYIEFVHVPKVAGFPRLIRLYFSEDEVFEFLGNDRYLFVSEGILKVPKFFIERKAGELWASSVLGYEIVSKDIQGDAQVVHDIAKAEADLRRQGVFADDFIMVHQHRGDDVAIGSGHGVGQFVLTPNSVWVRRSEGFDDAFEIKQVFFGPLDLKA